MRFGLLGQKMIGEGEFGVIEAKVVAVCPEENLEFRNEITSPGLRRRFPECRSIETVLRQVWKNPELFAMTTQETLVDAARAAVDGLGDWASYLKSRY